MDLLFIELEELCAVIHGIYPFLGGHDWYLCENSTWRFSERDTNRNATPPLPFDTVSFVALFVIEIALFLLIHHVQTDISLRISDTFEILSHRQRGIANIHPCHLTSLALREPKRPEPAHHLLWEVPFCHRNLWRVTLNSVCWNTSVIRHCLTTNWLKFIFQTVLRRFAMCACTISVRRLWSLRPWNISGLAFSKALTLNLHRTELIFRAIEKRIVPGSLKSSHRILTWLNSLLHEHSPKLASGENLYSSELQQQD